MRRITAAVLVAAVLGLLGAQAAPAALAGQPEQKTLISGWYRDRAVKYFDFGANTPLVNGTSSVQTAPIYVFIHGMNADGSPDFVEGQHNIVDVLPGEPGYSDLWQVMLVTVPDDYEPDSVTSKDEIDDAGFEVMPTDMYVNCPIVPEGTTLEGGKPLVQGWNKGEEVYYPDFGANPPVALPIWVLIHGMNADGTPDFVEGQQNIIDSIPEDPGYSAFWRVNLVTVPADYAPNSIRSASEVLAAGYPITETDMAVNCPVTEVADAATPPTEPSPAPPPTGTTGGEPVAAPSTGTGDAVTGGGTATVFWIAGALALMGIALGGAGYALDRRR